MVAHRMRVFTLRGVEPPLDNFSVAGPSREVVPGTMVASAMAAVSTSLALSLGSRRAISTVFGIQGADPGEIPCIFRETRELAEATALSTADTASPSPAKRRPTDLSANSPSLRGLAGYLCIGVGRRGALRSPFHGQPAVSPSVKGTKYGASAISQTLLGEAVKLFPNKQLLQANG